MAVVQTIIICITALLNNIMEKSLGIITGPDYCSPLGNTQIYLVVHSLIRIFAGEF